MPTEGESLNIVPKPDRLRSEAENSVNGYLTQLEAAGLEQPILNLFKQPPFYERFIRMSRVYLNQLPEKAGTSDSESSFNSGLRLLINQVLLLDGWNNTPKKLGNFAATDSQKLANEIVLISSSTDLGKTGFQLNSDDAIALLYLLAKFKNGVREKTLSQATKTDAYRQFTDADLKYIQDNVSVSPDTNLGEALTVIHTKVMDKLVHQFHQDILDKFGFEISLAQCHHLTSGQYSENLNIETDFTATTLHIIALIEVADKYQAFLERYRNPDDTKLTPLEAKDKTWERLSEDYQKNVPQNPQLHRILENQQYLDRCQYWVEFFHDHRQEFFGINS